MLRFKHEVLSFLNPFEIANGGNGYNMSWIVQVGSKKYPETEVTSIAESFSLLKQTKRFGNRSHFRFWILFRAYLHYP